MTMGQEVSLSRRQQGDKMSLFLRSTAGQMLSSAAAAAVSHSEDDTTRSTVEVVPLAGKTFRSHFCLHSPDSCWPSPTLSAVADRRPDVRFQ